MITNLELGGMVAVHAVRAVFTALAGVDGVRGAEVKLGSAEVEHDQPLDLAALQRALEPIGVEVIAATTTRRRLGVRDDGPGVTP